MKPGFDTVARWFALAWAASASAYLLVAPFSGMSSSTPGADPVGGNATLLEVVGPRLLIILAIPVLAASMALIPVPQAAEPWRLAVAAAVAVGFVLLGALTVGVFFLPTAIALVVVMVRAAATPRTN